MVLFLQWRLTPCRSVHQHSAFGLFLSAFPIPLLGMCSSTAPRLLGKEGCESKSCPSYSQ